MLGAALVFSNAAIGAAIDDVQLQVGQERCQGFKDSDQSHVVYATNSNSTRPITVRFKYDSVPSKQHFILFDAALNPGGTPGDALPSNSPMPRYAGLTPYT